MLGEFQCLWVGNGVSRSNTGSHGTEAIVPFAVEPVEETIFGAFFTIREGFIFPIRNVIDHRVACNILQGILFAGMTTSLPDDHAQFAFVVYIVRRHPGNRYCCFGIVIGCGRFHEYIGKCCFPFRRFTAALAYVGSIVARQQQNLAGRFNRTQQTHFFDG